jgi:hypothetical protein
MLGTVLWIRILMFWGFLDPDLDPLVKGTDPDPSIKKCLAFVLAGLTRMREEPRKKC